VRTAVLFAFSIEAGDCLEDLQPVGGVATNFDLRARGSKGSEGLVEQVAHNARLWLVADRADVADGQVVVDTHVALEETSHLPVVSRTVVVLEDEDVAAARGALITLATALVIGMRQRTADRITQRLGIAGLGRAHAVGQTSFFH
jgi:hypothetical protein